MKKTENKKIVKGLSSHKAQKLLEKYGFNELTEKSQSSIKRLLKKIVEPIPLMIEAALILSLLTGRWEDFYIILVLLIVNISVNFIQEEKARNSLEELKKTLTPTALVLRDDIFQVIPARELVPGDIIKLVLGDIVPADAKIISQIEISIDQATITGESLPVIKQYNDKIYASSIIVQGDSLAQITQTGQNTFVGKSANLLTKNGIGKPSHFQQAMLKIGKFLIVLALALIIITATIMLIRGDSLLETMRFSLVLAIASIPVALPTVLAVTMAIGAHSLAKSKAIVSNFMAIEELAGIDTLCVDKTGTLTKNEIAVIQPKVYDNFLLEDLFIYGMLASEKENKTSIEKAIFHYAQAHHYNQKTKLYQISKFTPFNPVDKMTKVEVNYQNHSFQIIMGAPQVMIDLLTDQLLQQKIFDDVAELAQNGFRTMIIVKKIKKEIIPVGLLPLLDPPRDDSKSVIANIKKQGVKIKMITGDNSLIAKYIAQVLKIRSTLMTSIKLSQLIKTKQDKHLIKKIVKHDVFAEVTPEDKYDIIDILQSTGHIVAMTGDGVNDAPALKKADVGIAVSGASAVARSVADIVLLDSGLKIIEKSIILARATFARMQSYATFRIAETIRIVFFVSLTIIFFNETPLTAVMIILLALLNDIPVMAIAYDNAQPSSEPVKWNLKETIFISSLLGIAGLISSFFLLWWLHSIIGVSIILIQTIIFLKLDVSGHSTLYLTRTGRKHFWQRPFPSLKFFIPAFSSRIIGTIIAMAGILMEPISWQIVVIIWIYSTFWFVFNDQIKVVGYKIWDKYLSKKFI
jgi:H+-transporting ATPase